MLKFDIDIPIHNVLLVKIEGPGAGIPSIIISLLFKGFLQTPLLLNQPMGKGHLQCEAPKIDKLVYNSNNYGLWHL